MELCCCIAGCGDPAYTVYFGLMLCDECYRGALEAIEPCRGDVVELERLLVEFAEPNRREDKEDGDGLEAYQRMQRVLERAGLRPGQVRR